MQAPLLEITDLSKSFGGIRAIAGFSIRVKPNSIHSVIGPNGAGKSSLFNCISGFYEPDAGSIIFNGASISKVPPYRRISLGISRSFQNVELFDSLSVEENLLLGLHTHVVSNIWDVAINSRRRRRSEDAAATKVAAILDRLGLEKLGKTPVKDLPFGYRKLIDIARAVISRPVLLMLDEPVAGLNDEETTLFGKMISKLKDELGLTILMVEHDMSIVMKLSDQITVMNFGSNIASGTPEQVRSDPAVISAYLGDEN